MQRRVVLHMGLALGAAAALSACGFQLRQAPDYAFRTIFIGLPPSSLLGTELRRQLNSSGKVTVFRDAAEMLQADVVMDVLQEQRERVVVGVNSDGQVRELQLRLRFRFRLRTPQGKELIPDTEILQQRDISFSETNVLSKDAEEQLLYRDMQSDTVQQILRRLGALKAL